MVEDMGCAGREGKNNGRNKRMCGGERRVENESMKYLGEVWTERQRNERNHVNVIL